ncbi:MAG: protein kinase domain-containing protein [Kofleriaceae bacterium]
MSSSCLPDDLLAAFVVGEASDEELVRIEAHLAGCATCATLCRAASVVYDHPPTRLDPDRLRWSLPEVPRGTSIGRFLILDVIGWGGMGVVYSAYDPELDRRVALKFLATSFDPIRLVREARAIARLTHPNVVSVHDVGEHRGAPYVAMELVDGETLDRRLARARDWPEILSLFLQSGEGLAAAHAAGVIHRDFKPSNVLVGADGRVRVSDFGLARLDERADDPGELGHGESSSPGAERATAVGARIGTPAYMAPEQRGGSRVDARADQYSFALALHEAMFGRRPSGTAVRGGHEPMTEVPAELRAALDRALSTDPDARFPSMKELLDVLRAHDPTDPRTVGQAALDEAHRRTVRGRRIVWFVLTITLALIAGTAVVTMIISRRERDRAREAEVVARRAERLADRRLEDELRANIRFAYERGDLVGSLGHVAQLFERGSDDPFARAVVASVSWAWPSERALYRGVRSVVPVADGERTLIELDAEFLVVDGRGAILARVPISASSRGIDIDARGEQLLILDPDLRLIPVAHPDLARVITRAPPDGRWIVPKFVGESHFAVRSDDDILVLDERGGVVQRIAATAIRVSRLASSNRVVLASDDTTAVVSFLSGKRVTRAVGSYANAERRSDRALALAERGRVTIVDEELRPLRSIEIGGDAHRVVFSDDGKTLGVAIDDHVLLFDTTTGQRRGRIASHRDTTFVFDGEDVWTGVDGIVQRWSTRGVIHARLIAPNRAIDAIWRTPTGLAVSGASTVLFYAAPLSRATAMPGDCVAVEAMGRDPIHAVCADHTLRRWSTTGVDILAHDADTPEWVFGEPSGLYVVALGYKQLTVVSGLERRTTPLPIESIKTLVATPTAVLVATVQGLRRLDIVTMKWTELGHPDLAINALTSIRGTDDQALGIVNNREIVEIHHDKVGVPRRLPFDVLDLTTSGDGTAIAVQTAADNVVVLDRATLQPLHQTPLSTMSITSMALDQRGARLAVSTSDDRVMLLDVQRATAIELPFGSVSATVITFSSDDRSVVVNLNGTPTRVELLTDERPFAALAADVACRFGASPLAPAGPRSCSSR